MSQEAGKMLEFAEAVEFLFAKELNTVLDRSDASWYVG
jgi:hypothetical protein